jgi:large subunit ribosomal protein L3
MLRSGVIAEKVGMSAIFLEDGKRVPVTLLRFVNCCVAAHKVDGEKNSLQIAAGSFKNISKPLKGYYEKAGLQPRRLLKEFRVSSDAVMPVGAKIVPSYFPIGNYVDVTGVTIGKGFAGAMKRHNFGGLRASHGVSVSHRSHGSTGNRKDPGRVFKGKKMAGHMGTDRVTVQNLQVVAVDEELSLLIVRGSVPGHAGSFVWIRDAIKKSLLQNINIPELASELSFAQTESQMPQDLKHTSKEES